MEAFESKLVIGLTGQKGAGKETFTNIFTELAAPRKVAIEVFSSLLVETARTWHIPPTRDDLQKIPKAMISEFGPDVLANAVYFRTLEKEGDIVILDGARTESDLALVRRFPNNLFVYVTADPEIRWKRLRERGQKEGEREATFEQFMQEENAFVERSIPLIGSKADFEVDNNGDRDQLRSQVEEFYKAQVLKMLT